MTLAAGDKLGPYQIISMIGKGGMGEVYSAHDPRTGRDVAIKVSAERFNERFDREVRAVASLNHPNICTLYDVGPNYLVMEFIEGEAPQGPLPLDTAMNYARQIAAALEEAHEKGVVHRDLKPGNIKVKPDGTVKVLDFGLAKMGGTSAAQSENSPTLSIAATQAGMILGTAAYMAPEQARGKPIDKRADIWAFGVVFYEMLVGQRLFKGEDLTDTLASVVKERPDLSQAPASVRRLLERCLEKDPKRRLRDIGDVWELLEDGKQDAVGRTRQPSLLPWVAAGILSLGLGIALWAPWRKPEPALEVFRYRLPMPANSIYIDTAGPAVSGDGRKLAFTASLNGVPRVWVQSLDSLEEARPLAGTEGSVFPIFWSFDSRWVMFQLNGKLMKVEVAGGAPVTLCDLNGQISVGGSENAAGRILIGLANEALWQIPSVGGVPTPVTKLDRARGDTANNQPMFLPDGRHFLYFRRSGSPENTGTYLGDLEATPETQSMRLLIPGSTAGKYAPPRGPHPGFILFHRDGNLFTQAFDERGLELAGDPVRIADKVGTFLDGGLFSFGNNTLMYRSSSTTPYQLTWFDRQGKRAGAAGQATSMQFTPAISPQGTRVVVARASGSTTGSLWRIDLEKNTELQLTAVSGFGGNPVWSPDGTQIVFSSSRRGPLDLYRKAADGASDEVPLLESAEDKVPYSWSRDGKFLLYGVVDPKTGPDIWVLRLDSPKKTTRLVGTPAAESYPQFAPNMRWMAYSSNESGGVEQVFVRELFPEQEPNPFRLGPAQIVSRNGGSKPAWRGDGKELFYEKPDGTIMAAAMGKAELATGPLEPGEPVALFQQPALLPGLATWAVRPDGQRLLFVASAQTEVQTPFTMVVNWQAGLK